MKFNQLDTGEDLHFLRRPTVTVDKYGTKCFSLLIGREYESVKLDPETTSKEQTGDLGDLSADQIKQACLKLNNKLVDNVKAMKSFAHEDSMMVYGLCLYCDILETLVDDKRTDNIGPQYQLRMRIDVDGLDWLKILQEVCGKESTVEAELRFILWPTENETTRFKVTTGAMKIFPRTDVEAEEGEQEEDEEVDASNYVNYDTSSYHYCADWNLSQESVNLKNLLHGIVHGNHWSMMVGWKVWINVENDSDLFAVDAISTLEMNRRILKDELGTDVEIVASQGAVIKCHQSFLAVRSPVLHKMLTTEMKEGISKRIEMQDTSEKSIRAFLLYLYTGELEEAGLDSEISVDILQLAHKYDIPPLERKMKNKLKEMPNCQFRVDVAVELFCFMRRLPDRGREKLMTKAIRILRTKRNTLRKSQVLKSLLKDDTDTAMDLLKFALED